MVKLSIGILTVPLSKYSHYKKKGSGNEYFKSYLIDATEP